MDEDAARRAEQKANVLSLKAKTKKERERARDTRAQLKKVQRALDDLRDKLRGDLDDKYEFIKGVSVEMSGRRLEKLATEAGPDHHRGRSGAAQRPRRICRPPRAGAVVGVVRARSPDRWVTGKAPATAPAIAIVDSGIEANRLDFGGGARVIEHEVITSLLPNSAGDGRGHGTFVASIAAGSAPGRLGASPTSPIIDVDVMDDNGHGAHE